MSRYNVSRMIATYTDDFGNTYANLPIKIQKDAPLVDTIYVEREAAICAPAKFFTPRYLLATFGDGRQLKYPIENEGAVTPTAGILKSNGAVCIDYVGEKFNFLLGATVGGDLAYRSDRYEGLVPSKEFEVGSFLYTSNLEIPGIAVVKLPYRVPANDNATLKECQMAGLVDPEESSGICAAKGIIIPRYFTIRAKADDGDGRVSSVARKALVSLSSLLGVTASQIAPCAFCLSYQGESVKGFESLIS